MAETLNVRYTSVIVLGYKKGKDGGDFIDCIASVCAKCMHKKAKYVMIRVNRVSRLHVSNVTNQITHHHVKILIQLNSIRRLKMKLKKAISSILILIIVTLAAIPTVSATPNSHTGGREDRFFFAGLGAVLREERVWGETEWSVRHTTTAQWRNRFTGTVSGTGTRTGTGTTRATSSWIAPNQIQLQARTYWRPA